MGGFRRDPDLDTLLDLDSQVYIVDPTANHWVKFSVKRVESSPERPHGLRTIRPYEYKDAAALLLDFWAEVNAVLEERGVIR